MAGWTCAGCTTVYTVGAAKCPQCGSTERTDAPGGSVLPSVTVACATADCRFTGVERRVHLRTATPGVLELPPLICAGCGSHVLTTENTMAKITVHGGPSNAAAAPEPVDETPEQGGEQPSPDGGTSSTSSEAEPSSPETSEPARPQRARTTGSRSKQARKAAASSTADSTDTSGPETAAADH